MKENNQKVNLEQKVLAAATGIFAGLGALWLINDIADAIIGNSNPYETVKDTVFNVGVPTLAYVSAATSLYLTKLFSYNNLDNFPTPTNSNL